MFCKLQYIIFCQDEQMLFFCLKIFFIKSLDIRDEFQYKYSRSIASSSNGRTADSDSVNRGSNPCEAAKRKKKATRKGGFFYV